MWAEQPTVRTRSATASICSSVASGFITIIIGIDSLSRVCLLWLAESGARRGACGARLVSPARWASKGRAGRLAKSPVIKRPRKRRRTLGGHCESRRKSLGHRRTLYHGSTNSANSGLLLGVGGLPCADRVDGAGDRVLGGEVVLAEHRAGIVVDLVAVEVVRGRQEHPSSLGGIASQPCADPQEMVAVAAHGLVA